MHHLFRTRGSITLSFLICLLIPKPSNHRLTIINTINHITYNNNNQLNFIADHSPTPPVANLFHRNQHIGAINTGTPEHLLPPCLSGAPFPSLVGGGSSQVGGFSNTSSPHLGVVGGRSSHMGGLGEAKQRSQRVTVGGPPSLPLMADLTSPPTKQAPTRVVRSNAGRAFISK